MCIFPKQHMVINIHTSIALVKSFVHAQYAYFKVLSHFFPTEGQRPLAELNLSELKQTMQEMYCLDNMKELASTD